MARVEVNYVVTAVTTSSGKVAAANGASVQINNRNADGSSGAAATLFTTPDTGSTRSNPVSTDSAGRISRDGAEVWLDPGQYNLVITGTGLLTQTLSFNAPEEPLSTFKALHRARGGTSGSAVAGSIFLMGTTSLILSSGQGFPTPFYLDPADYGAGSRVVKYRIRHQTVNSTNTASNASYQVGLYPVSSIASGVVTIGAVVAGSQPSVIATPAGNSLLQGVGSVFSAPVAGFYCLGVLTSAATENVSIDNFATLQMQQV